MPEATGSEVVWRRPGSHKAQFPSEYAHSLDTQSRGRGGHDCTGSRNHTFVCSARASRAWAPPSAGDGKRVLVVEDEALLRELMTQHLRHQGYDVVQAHSAAEALARVREAEPPFDAAIVDLGLPDRPGEALLAELHVELPELPILVVSGYGEAALGKLADRRGIASLAKPCDLASMQMALEALLSTAMPMTAPFKPERLLLSQQDLTAERARLDHHDVVAAWRRLAAGLNRAAFPKGPCLRLRDELGPIYDDDRPLRFLISRPRAARPRPPGGWRWSRSSSSRKA